MTITYRLNINKGSLRFFHTGPDQFSAFLINGWRQHDWQQHQGYFSPGICRTTILGVNTETPIDYNHISEITKTNSGAQSFHVKEAHNYLYLAADPI